MNHLSFLIRHNQRGLILGLAFGVLCIGALVTPMTASAQTSASDEGADTAVVSKMADRIDPMELVSGAIDLTRGISSYAEMTMLIHRPKWQRKSSLKAWTRGREDAVIRFTAPVRDAGNALLKQGERMWNFNPKLNKSIRLPGGMMSQSWAGSDFSYDDMSRSDKWLRHYSLEWVASEQVGEHVVHTIDAIPHDDAPVVWGKEQLVIRDDLVLINLTYFDQDMQPVRVMKAITVAELGGRQMATVTRMQELEKRDQFTEVTYTRMDFDVEHDDQLFTLFALQSRGRN